MGEPVPAATWSWPEVLTSLIAGQDLPEAAAAWAMDEVMSGAATPVQIAGFLTALRAKGESVLELGALADNMLAHAVRIEVPGTTLDIVGTGGDRAHTVNISTMAALVAAGAGVRVVKHGNRAASSSSGSADVLEALGINLTLSPERVAATANRAGITFCFAQQFHPSMRYAAAARSGLGIPTAFNFLGPLTNPAQPTFAAVGVADSRMAELIAGVFAGRGRQAVVFRGDDGLDELTLSTTSTIWWVHAGTVSRWTLDPAALGLSRQPLEALRGADPAYNASVVRDVLAGKRGAVRDAVVLNAGMALALTAAGRAPSSGADLVSMALAGMARAAAAVDTGAASRTLDGWVAATRL